MSILSHLLTMSCTKEVVMIKKVKKFLEWKEIRGLRAEGQYLGLKVEGEEKQAAATF